MRISIFDAMVLNVGEELLFAVYLARLHFFGPESQISVS